MTDPIFKPFPKLARFSRTVIVTEKIDGTNAQVHVTEAGDVLAGSRNQWIGGGGDHFGFADWVKAHRAELLALGPGSHFGEWWGQGIQRGYGLTEKRFSLFNVQRWADGKPNPMFPERTAPPACCSVVPVLLEGPFDSLGGFVLSRVLELLRREGSYAAPGFMKPEGVVIWHTAANIGFKKTLERDDEWKGKTR